MDRAEAGRIYRRLRQLSPQHPPAVILGNGSSTDLSFVRSLTSRGIPTLHLVADRQLGSFSRKGLRMRMPAVEGEPGVWIKVLEEIASSATAPPVLLFVSDAHCAFVSQHAAALGGRFRLIVPDASDVETILDKQLQYAAATHAGLSVPATFYPDTLADVERIAADLSRPVILKPCTAHMGRRAISNRKVVVVHRAGDLVSEYTRCTASGARFMIQEIVPGPDDAIFWYSGFWDDDARELAWFTAQKLRQCPPGFGDGCFQRTVEATDVLNESRRVLAAIRYRGLVMIEFKRDPRTGACMLIEINPRAVSGNQLGIQAGVDLPWIAYSYLANEDRSAAPERRFALNVQYVHEEWDLQSFWALRRAGQLTLAAWLRSLRGTRALALFAWDDPAPLAVGVWRFILIGLRRLIRQWRPVA